jgi:hypothetical protein
MKRIIAFSLLWFAAILGHAQVQGPFTLIPWQATVYTCPWTDSFSGTGALGTAWKTFNNSTTFAQASGVVQLAALSKTAQAAPLYAPCSWLVNGQYAQATVAAVANNTGKVGLGVAVDPIHLTGYIFAGNTNTSAFIYSMTAGAFTPIATCTSSALAATNVIKIIITGASAPWTITVYRNGTPLTGCSASSSLYSPQSGAPAMYIMSDATSVADHELSSFSGN